MASADLNEMIEGDLMYTDQLQLLHEEVILTSDYESINQDDSNHSDSIVIDDTTDDDEIKIICCKIKTTQEDASDDDVQIIASNITEKQEPLISVYKTPFSSSHTNESQNKFKCNPDDSVEGMSTSYSLNDRPLPSNQTYESQNIFKCEPDDGVGAISTFYSLDDSPLPSSYTNESQNIFKCDPDDGAGAISASYSLDSMPKFLLHSKDSPLPSSHTNESQNIFKCDPDDGVEAISTSYSLDNGPLPSSHINESQSGSKGDLTDRLRNVSAFHQKTLPKEIKKRFVSKDLIHLYCVNCNKINKIFKRSKIHKCRSCKTLLKYQCTQCQNLYKTFQKAFLHVKFQCELAKNHIASFHCSACYYDTRNQANLENHILNHHAVKKCIGCNEERENGRMTKHRIFECKAPGNDHIRGEIKTSPENVKKRRGRRPKYVADSIFLIKYCKFCDETKDITAGGDYSFCRDCNTVFQHQCVTCCKRFQKLATAKIHIHSCNYPPRFQCSDCNYQTAYKANLIAHLDNQHNQKECEVCLAVCDSKLSLRKHEKYECRRHPRFKGLKLQTKPKSRKMTNTFNALKLYCSRCKEGYERTSCVLSNCKNCNNQVRWQCVKCLVLFKHLSTGYKHVKRGCRIKEKKVNIAKVVREKKVATKNTYKHKICPECHRNNLEPESFDAHLKECKSRPSFPCSSCTFKTKNKKNLRKHYKNIHLYAKKYFPCSICQNKFKYSSLRKHQVLCRIVNKKNIS